MTIVFLASAVFGMTIGLRRKVLIVFPATLVVGIAVIAVAAAMGKPTSTIVSLAAVSAVAIQIGYVCTSLAASILKEAPSAPSQAMASPMMQPTHLGLNSPPRATE
jgi:hypothetical protein